MAVQLCKYPPVGERGVGPGRPIQYGLQDPRNYLLEADEEVLVAVMIEEPEAVRNLEAIAAIPGIDVFNLGPWDLSTAYGFPIEERHPLVERALEKALNLGRLHGIAVGVSPLNQQETKELYNKGARFFEAVSIESCLAVQLHAYRQDCKFD